MRLSQVYTTVLLDMDGVLADVSKSYRAAIEATCHKYGATNVNQQVITEWKARGNANDDWKLSYDLIQRHNPTDVTLEQVTATFEDFYQGTADTPGLCELESLIPNRDTLLQLRQLSRPGMGIVTGRPRKDCMKFLKQHDLEDLFDVTHCMEDGPSKPDPYPVQRACELLGIEPSKRVVLVGDTPDDIQAALNAGCSGVGVTTPEASREMEQAGKHHSEAQLSGIMLERGADKVLPPGFADLIGLMAAPSNK